MQELSENQKKVQELLLMPIVICKGCEKPYIGDEGIIYTGINYVTDGGAKSCDEDMSDIAVGFYEVIYGRSVLNENGKLIDKAFAGDTMNSYNRVAQNVLRIRTSINQFDVEQRGSEKKRELEVLAKYKKNYHCLANFWLIPYSSGRDPKEKKASKNQNARDYMDRFLKIYEKKFESIFGKTFDELINDHFLEGSYVKNGKILSYSSPLPNNRLELLQKINDAIRNRAYSLAVDKTDELIEYFISIGIWNIE